eukprot:scaffold36716_cov41-Attheya_sp.AAC.4
MNVVAENILTLPLNEREKHNNKRSRLGFHVYLSRFFFDFKGLPELEKREIILSDPFLDEAAAGYYGVDESDEDSVDSIIQVRHVDVMRLACNGWRFMSPERKDGWNARAAWLNSHPVPGRFVELPANIGNPDVLDAMTLDWARVVSLFRNSITRRPKVLTSTIEVLFGKEKVKIGSQSYRKFELNNLIKLSLFGKNWSKLRHYETVFKSKRSALIHIASENRMTNIFTLWGLCGSAFEVSGLVHTCCGKVSIKMDGQHCVGYIVDENESGNVWTIKLATNEIIELEKPQYNEKMGAYIYSINERRSARVIEQYWPIRILLQNSGRGKYTLNRVTYDNNNRINAVHSS